MGAETPVHALALALAFQLYYVDASATGANDGSSWQNAFTELHEAMAVAGPNDTVWVARGTYKPTSDRDRTRSFLLDCSVYGGRGRSPTAARS